MKSRTELMAGKKVIVAGHICLDITPVFPESARGKGSEILMPGKLVETKAASVSTGGAVANTGLAMKILCADPDFTEKGGADAGRAGDEGADTESMIIWCVYGRFRPQKYKIV